MPRPANSPHAFAENFSLALTQAPLVDRRALSQAWYDALRLAQRSRSVPRRPLQIRNEPARSLRLGKEPAPRRLVEELAPLRLAVSSLGTRSAPQPLRHAAGVARKGDDLARKIIERVREQPSETHAVVNTPQGRVCLFVRRDRNAVRIVALCPPAAKLRVERALAQARLTLARLGVGAAC